MYASSYRRRVPHVYHFRSVLYRSCWVWKFKMEYYCTAPVYSVNEKPLIISCTDFKKIGFDFFYQLIQYDIQICALHATSCGRIGRWLFHREPSNPVCRVRLNCTQFKKKIQKRTRSLYHYIIILIEKNLFINKYNIPTSVGGRKSNSYFFNTQRLYFILIIMHTIKLRT